MQNLMHPLIIISIDLTVLTLSGKPLKPLFGSFADGADVRGAFAGTEIAADLASPHRQGECRRATPC